MTRQQRVNRLPSGAIAAGIIALLAAGGGAAWWGLHGTNPPPPSTTVPNIVQQTTPPQAAQSTTAQIYLLRDTGKNLELVPKPIEVNTKQPNAVLEAAFQGLLAGSDDAKISSTIPAGTKLRSLKVQDDGVHIDLSQEFTTGGGSASMSGRLAQVIYTATTLDANANVWIEVEGKPLELLGGEGLEVTQPMTRQSFQENFTL